MCGVCGVRGAWVHKGSPLVSDRRALHLLCCNPAWEVSSTRRTCDIVPVLKMCALHAVRATCPARGQGQAGSKGRDPIHSVPQLSPDCPPVLSECSEDTKGSPVSVSASSLPLAFLVVVFLVLSSPEPLFFSDLSVLDAFSRAWGLCFKPRRFSSLWASSWHLSPQLRLFRFCFRSPSASKL